MWTCATCGSHLLDSTVDCPLCRMPDGGDHVFQDPPPSAEFEESGKTWLMIVIGTLIPPLGFLFLCLYLAQKLTPRDSDLADPGELAESAKHSPAKQPEISDLTADS